MPHNGRLFTKELEKLAGDENNKAYLKEIQFSVFGLGDSGYLYYNVSAKKIDDLMAKLGASRTVKIGLGDDKAEEKYETAFWDWLPELCS